MSHDPIAYIYDADHHCPECAEARFGLSVDGRWIAGEDENGNYPEDSEGNAVGVLAPWDEWWNADDECEVLACGTCGAVIDNAHAFDCHNAGGDDPCSIPDWALV